MIEDRVRVGLVICGTPPPALEEFSAGYLPMFDAILAPHGIELEAVDARSSRLAVEPDRVDGYLLTGSASSVYDPDPWIADAADFVRDVVAADVPLAGVCFGHQLIAHALGGRVEKATVGWGAGVHAYTVTTPLTEGGEASMRLQAMHQDQVLDPPRGAVVWATSEFCPVAGYTVGDAVWTVQGHPEFTARLSEGIIAIHAETFGPELAAASRASVHDPTDAAAVGAVIARFFRSAVGARRAQV